MKQNQILDQARDYAVKYLQELPERRAFPDETSLKELDRLLVPLPGTSTAPEKVLEVLHTIGSRNTVASNGGRYFGFVFGGTFPVVAGCWNC